MFAIAGSPVTFGILARQLAGCDLSLKRLSLAILLWGDACLQAEETSEMRLVLEAQHCRYLLDALAAVAQHYLGRTNDFAADKLVCGLSRQALADTRKVLGRNVEETCVLVDIEVGLRRVVEVLHELAEDVLARAISLVQQFFVLEFVKVVQVVCHRSKEQP